MMALKPGLALGPGTPEVLRVVRVAVNLKDTVYRIKMPCCGTEVDMAHWQLKDRVSKGYQRCRHCYKPAGNVKKSRTGKRPKKAAPAVPAVQWPTWPKPASVPLGRGTLR